MTDRQQELIQQREKLDQLVKQAKKDSKFKEKLKHDPVGVLEQAGISRQAIGDFLGEEGYRDRDPNDPTLTAQQKAAIKMHRECQGGCCLTCLFTSECRLTVG